MAHKKRALIGDLVLTKGYQSVSMREGKDQIDPELMKMSLSNRRADVPITAFLSMQAVTGITCA